jgi:hypothetical protein
MAFGTVNTYRPRKGPYRLGIPYRFSRADDSDWVVPIIVVICLTGWALLVAAAMG